jgi:recA bacterial DNA recombination protein
MSSLLATVPVLGNSVVFSPPETSVLKMKRITALPKLAAVTPASRLEVRPAPEMVSSGIAEVDALTGGLPRGCLTEIYGAASSGRTSVLLAALAASTQRQEVCALVDATDALNPLSAAAAGVDFSRLLWVRCGMPSPRAASRVKKEHMENPLEQALRVTDLLLQSGGFGMVAIDFGDVPFAAVRRIPLTSWFRFQRAVENTSTVLFVIAETPCARTCASLLLKVQSSVFSLQSSAETCSPLAARPAHAELLDGLQIEGELLRSRLERKPSRSVTTEFASSALRTG